MKKLVLAALAVAALSTAPIQTQAQVVVGPHVAYHTDDVGVGVGGFAVFPLTSVHQSLAILVDGTLFFPDGFDFMEFSGSGVFSFPMGEGASVSPFVMAGVTYGRVSVEIAGDDVSSSDTDLSVGGGLSFLNLGSIQPAVGLRAVLADETGLEFFAGLGFPLGG